MVLSDEVRDVNYSTLFDYQSPYTVCKSERVIEIGDKGLDPNAANQSTV